MRGLVYTHNKTVKSLARSFSEKVTTVFLGFLLVASPVIGVIPPKTVHAASPDEVVINEFVSNGAEWVELVNTTSSTISLSGWTLSDNGGSGTFKTFGVGDNISAYGFFVYDIAGSVLNNTGDSIVLDDNGSLEIDSVTYPGGVGVPAAGQSAGRTTDGAASFTVFATPTKGAANAPDSTNPIVTPVQPLANHYINHSNSFRTLATDTGLGSTGINTVTMRLHGPSGDSGTLTTSGPNGSGQYVRGFNTDTVADGLYQVDFTATDNAGNSTTATEANIVVDNTTPLADITTPSDNDTLSGTVDISGNGSDLNIRGYRIRIYEAGNVREGAHVASLGRFDVAGTSFGGVLTSWDTTLLPDGDYVLQLSVRDGPWNTGFDHVPVTIDNIPDEIPEGYGSIHGRKFRDVNANGERDAEDRDAPNRLDNWTINLYDDEWNPVASTVTSASLHGGRGVYRFGHLTWGTYYVCEVMQDGWEQTHPHGGMAGGIANASPNAALEGTFCRTGTISYGPTTPGSDTDNERERELNFGNIEEQIEVPVDLPPAVDAGTDVASSTTFVQNASASDDNGIVSYAWGVVSGPGAVTFNDAATEDPSISADTNGVYVIRLTVDDGVNAPVSDTFTLTWTNPAGGGGSGGGGGGSAGPVVIATFADTGLGGAVLGTDTEDPTETDEDTGQTSSLDFDGGEVLAESDETGRSWWSSWWKWLLLLIPLMLLLFFILARRRKDDKEDNK